MELFVAVLRLNISSDNLFLTYLFRKSSLKTASVSPRLSRKLSNNLRLMDLRFLWRIYISIFTFLQLIYNIYYLTVGGGGTNTFTKQLNVLQNIFLFSYIIVYRWLGFLKLAWWRWVVGLTGREKPSTRIIKHWIFNKWGFPRTHRHRRGWQSPVSRYLRDYSR